jgi:hypothetical protein
MAIASRGCTHPLEAFYPLNFPKEKNKKAVVKPGEKKGKDGDVSPYLLFLLGAVPTKAL